VTVDKDGASVTDGFLDVVDGTVSPRCPNQLSISPSSPTFGNVLTG